MFRVTEQTMKIFHSKDLFVPTSGVYEHVQRFVVDLTLINLHSGIPLERELSEWIQYAFAFWPIILSVSFSSDHKGEATAVH